jgi:hypothetical protein
MAVNRTNVIQTTVNSKIVEKAILLPKSVQLKLDFEIQATAWIPKAKANKPMPQICLSLAANIDKLRLNADTTDELIEALGEIMTHLATHKDTLDKMVDAEQTEWLELCNKQRNNAKKSKIIPLQRVS